MSNLRETKKQQTKEQILEAAQEIFMTLGYEKTTIAQIASRANIANGTFYNYFVSKAELFLYLIFAHPDELEDKANAILNNPSEDVLETLIALCNVYLDAMQNFGKRFGKEIIAVFASNIDEHRNTMREFINLDFQFIEQVSHLLAFYQQKGILINRFDAKDAAECIYGIFVVQMIMYFFEEEQTFEVTKNKIIRQIKFLWLLDELSG